MNQNQTINITITADDSHINTALERLTESAGKLNDTVGGVGKTGSETFEGMGDSIRDADRATAQAVRTAKEYQAQIERNDKVIEETSKSIRDQRIALLRLQQQLAKTKKGTKEYEALKAQIDTTTASITEQTRAVEILRLENQRAGDAINDLGGRMRLNAHEATNLGYQFQDLFVQIASGQGVIRPLIQQLPQMAGAVGGFRPLMRLFAQSFRAAGAALFSFTGLIAAATVVIFGFIALPFLAYLSKVEGAMDGINTRLAGLAARFNLLTERLASLGAAIVGLFDGTTKWGDVTAAAGKVAADGYGEAAEAARALKQEQIDLERAISKKIVQTAMENATIEENKRLLSDSNTPIREKISLLEQNRRLQVMQLKDEQDLARIARQRIEQALTETQIQNKQSKEHQEALAREIELQAKVDGLIYDTNQSIRDLRKEQAEQARERRQQLAELTRMTDEFLASIRKLQEGQLQGFAAIRAREAEALRAIDAEEKALRAAYAERRRVFDLDDELAQKRLLTQQIFAEETRKFAEAQQREARAREAEAEEFNRESIQRRLDAVLTLANKSADLQDSEIKRLAVISEGYQAQARLAQELFLAGQLTAAQVVDIRRGAEKARQAYEDALGEQNLSFLETFKQKVLKALNITAEEGAAIQSALNNALKATFDVIEQLNNERIARIDAQLQAIDKRIEEATTRVEEERARSAEGYANNLALAEQNLAKEQELRRKALEERAQLEARAARQQLAIDAAQQASSVVTSVANILARETASKGAIGAIIALSSIALIASIMARARAIAQQQREAVQGFATGTEYVEGAGTTTSDSIPARLSKGERVIPADLNAKLGGKNLTNRRLVELVELSKELQGRANIVEPTQIVGIVAQLTGAMQQAQEAQRREQLQAIKEATLQAAGRNAAEIIAYMKTRPIEYQTAEGRVIAYMDGGTWKTQLITKSE